LELPPKFASVEPPAATGPKPKRGDAHLRSTQAVNGYHLQATDGITGHVCGFLMDAKSWAINQIVIKIGHRFTGKEVQISVSKVTEISYDASKVFVNLTTDAGGKPISNSPPVMFTIESGPGEFPTGRTITFDETIDNPIRDGQAAIEFRSYYGGETIIRATSPGLKAATLKITTRGEPPFVAGRTPVAPDRPYVRFVRPEDFTAPGNQNVAYNRPTGASSEAPGHNGSRAVDGDANTYWSASDEQPGAWWQVDLEQPHSITAVQTTFPAAGNYRYRLEGSINGNSWTLLADNSQTDRAEPVRTDKIPSGQRVQIVRLTFTGLPVGTAAALAEVKITGQVAAQ
jgi:hypothetical protein